MCVLGLLTHLPCEQLEIFPAPIPGTTVSQLPSAVSALPSAISVNLAFPCAPLSLRHIFVPSSLCLVSSFFSLPPGGASNPDQIRAEMPLKVFDVCVCVQHVCTCDMFMCVCVCA